MHLSSFVCTYIYETCCDEQEGGLALYNNIVYAIPQKKDVWYNERCPITACILSVESDENAFMKRGILYGRYTSGE